MCCGPVAAEFDYSPLLFTWGVDTGPYGISLTAVFIHGDKANMDTICGNGGGTKIS